MVDEGLCECDVFFYFVGELVWVVFGEFVEVDFVDLFFGLCVCDVF